MKWSQMIETLQVRIWKHYRIQDSIIESTELEEFNSQVLSVLKWW